MADRSSLARTLLVLCLAIGAIFGWSTVADAEPPAPRDPASVAAAAAEKVEPDPAPAAKEEAKREAGEAAEEEKQPSKEITEHQTVYVGAYLNDVQTIDLKLHTYAIDLYMWFRWKSPDIDPATSFEFTNANESWGHVRTPNWETPQVMPDGSFYQVVHVQGRFSRKFLLYNYPFDRQTIEVSFEDSVLDARLLTYEPDPEGFTINPALVLPGFRSEPGVLDIRDVAYPTRFGDPRRTTAEAYSRATLRLPIHRPRDTYAIKLLLPVLCVIACAALMFVLRPSYVDARLSIGITALLTIVALQITLNADLPDVDYLVLMDKIYVGAYLFVIAGLAVVVRTTRMIERDEVEAAIRLHRRAMVLLLTIFLLATATMVALAIARG